MTRQSKENTWHQYNRPIPTFRAFIIIFLLILSLINIEKCLVEGSFSMVVDSGTHECFVIRAPGKSLSHISGNYDILDDDIKPDVIKVILYDSNHKEVWSSTNGAFEGKFSLNGKGRYDLCFHNGARPKYGNTNSYARMDGLERTVGFAVRVRTGITKEASMEDHARKDEEEGSEVEEHVDDLLVESFELLDDLEDLLDHQEYLKLREEQHRNLAEQTFSMINWWTGLEILSVCAVSIGQIIYIRKFFETRRFF